MIDGGFPGSSEFSYPLRTWCGFVVSILFVSLFLETTGMILGFHGRYCQGLISFLCCRVKGIIHAYMVVFEMCSGTSDQYLLLFSYQIVCS